MILLFKLSSEETFLYQSVLKSNSREFYLALKYFMDKDEYSNESIFAQILVAVTDFDVFMTMMREVLRALNLSIFDFIFLPMCRPPKRNCRPMDANEGSQ